MNKQYGVVLGALLMASPLAFGQFAGAEVQVQTAAAVKEMKDDSWVVLEGNIVKQLKDERYLFRDASGELEVEIDNDDWNGQAVKPDTRVRLSGEVDKGFRSIELDVDKVEVLDNAGAAPDGGFNPS